MADKRGTPGKADNTKFSSSRKGSFLVSKPAERPVAAPKISAPAPKSSQDKN